jgi:uronate dehydrogenase
MRQRVVITGAAGAVATSLVPLLRPHYELVLSDLRPPDWRREHDEFIAADLTDPDAMRSLVRGAHAVVHLGGLGNEGPWPQILAANIDGTYKLFEAARLERVQRVIYSSSVHAIGFYPRSVRLGVREFVRPDSRYGLSKCFGEAVGALYADKFAMRVLVIRIGNASAQPIDERRLSIWISARDLCQLMRIGLEHEALKYEIVYGASNNTRSWWNNEAAHRLGYRPQDDAEAFAAQLLRAGPIENSTSRGAQFQGGNFVEME